MAPRSVAKWVNTYDAVGKNPTPWPVSRPAAESPHQCLTPVQGANSPPVYQLILDGVMGHLGVVFHVHLFKQARAVSADRFDA